MIGKNIAKMRQAKNLTQKELAKGADISISYLRRIEHGKCPRPHIKTLAKIAHYLEVDISTLLKNT